MSAAVAAQCEWHQAIVPGAYGAWHRIRMGLVLEAASSWRGLATGSSQAGPAAPPRSNSGRSPCPRRTHCAVSIFRRAVAFADPWRGA